MKDKGLITKEDIMKSLMKWIVKSSLILMAGMGILFGLFAYWSYVLVG